MMDAKYLAEIKKDANRLVKLADNPYCQGPVSLLDGVKRVVPALLADVERLTAENQGLRANSMIQEHIISGWRDPIKDGEIMRLIMDNAAKDQQIATLKKALELMATYLVHFGRIDEMLCDDIPQPLHLKYQPKNDGDYENGPCIQCVQEYFQQQAQQLTYETHEDESDMRQTQYGKDDSHDLSEMRQQTDEGN